MKGKGIIILAATIFSGFFVKAQDYNWKGSWITYTEDTTFRPAPLFRKAFPLHKALKKATAYICGVGHHILTINGKPVTDAVLSQEFTRFDKTLLYNTYDVTSLLADGDNCVGVELGNGRYNVQSYTIWNFDKIRWRKSPRLLFNLALEYTDGSVETLSSDSTWTCATGASLFNSTNAGEIYDARLEIPGWNTAAFNDSNWKHALTTASPGGVLKPSGIPPIRVIRKIQPVSLKDMGNNTWLVDMGENFSGMAALTVNGNAGDTVTLHYGEVLTSDGQFDLIHNADQMAPYHNDLSFQTDKYILKGGGPETYTARFTYHGYQYVLVHGAKPLLEGLFYSTDFKPAGHFSSSDTMLNKLYAAAIQSYRSNFHSIPTDCPTREKNGWTGDAHVAAEMGLFNFHTGAVYKKWLRDVRDVQASDGNLPGIAPTLGIGFHWENAEDDGFGPAWGAALPIVTWYLYVYEGDTAVIKENYDAIKKYAERLVKMSDHYLYKTGFGDWLYIKETPMPLVSTGYFYTCIRLLSKMAGVVGNKEDQKYYGTFSDSIRIAYNKTFGNTDTTQTALSCPLYLQLTPEKNRKAVAAKLAASITKNNYHPTFGMHGAKFTLSALSDNGYADVAYKMLTDTAYPSWGHWIANGATTLYEDWDSKFSRNHVIFGDFCAWYFKALGGIQPDEKAPGFKHFFIKPVFPKGLDWVDVTHETKYGNIGVRWERKGNNINLFVTIPEGTTADVKANSYQKTLSSGQYEIKVSE